MPNWTYNQLMLKGEAEEVKKALDFMKSSESDFDFDKIIPTPESIKKSPCMSGEYAQDACDYYDKAKKLGVNAVKMWEENGIPDYLKKKEIEYNAEKKRLEDVSEDNYFTKMEKQSHSMTYSEMMKNYLTALQETGCVDWYGWNCANWGVKWNASDVVRDGDNFISFYTPWSAPIPVFHALVKRFPTITLEVDCEYEDGYRVEGVYYMKNGEIVAHEEEIEVEYEEGED